MTIHETAFDTTARMGDRTRVMQQTLQEAEQLKVLRELVVNVNNVGYAIGLSIVCGGHVKSDTIPAFNHPIYIDNGKGQMRSYVDARNFGRWDNGQQRFRVTNPDELLWNLRRAVLQHLWINEPKATFRDVSPLPIKLYCSMISQAISRRFSLNPAETLRVSVACAYAYLSFFSDDGEEDFDRVAIKITQAVGTWGREIVDEVLQNIEPVSNLEEMCECIKKSSQTVRLDEFNYGLLMNLVAGNWYGSNARETICVGLEHIPTWLMITWSSLTEATFKRSNVAKLAQQFDQRGAGDSFDLAMKALTGKLDSTKLSEI
jgi:hypothetical protein